MNTKINKYTTINRIWFIYLKYESQQSEAIREKY